MKKTLRYLVIAALVALPLGFASMFSGCATATNDNLRENEASKPRKVFGPLKSKGLESGQAITRTKAGETIYLAIRWVEGDENNGGHWSTAFIDSRKDAKLAGGVTGLIEIDETSTKIQIGAGEASSVGTDQVLAQGISNAQFLGGLSRLVDTVLGNPQSTLGQAVLLDNQVDAAADQMGDLTPGDAALLADLRRRIAAIRDRALGSVDDDTAVESAASDDGL